MSEASAVPRPASRSAGRDTAPALIRAILAWGGLGWLARFALASPFLISGVTKLWNFAGAVAEVEGLGLRPPLFLALLLIATQLGGAALFVTRSYCWLGAGLLAGFTAVATLVAHPFWSFAGPEAGRQMATFFEHLAIIGGFAAAAALVHKSPPSR